MTQHATLLHKEDILRLFQSLNDELAKRDVRGEVYLVGGAVMCLAFDARAATSDVDAFFQPAGVIRACAASVAHAMDLSSTWLNDGVKAFLSDAGTFGPYLQLPYLQVYCAQPEYLLAMKCLAMRLGEEFHDLDDVRYLLRYLRIEHYNAACAVITRFYPLERFPQKTLYILQELLP